MDFLFVLAREGGAAGPILFCGAPRRLPASASGAAYLLYCCGAPAAATARGAARFQREALREPRLVVKRATQSCALLHVFARRCRRSLASNPRLSRPCLWAGSWSWRVSLAPRMAALPREHESPHA